MPLISRREFVAAGLGAAASSSVPAFAVPQEPASLTLKQASDLLRHREASPLELAQACLKRIDQYNPSINAFITITPEQALAAARENGGRAKSRQMARAVARDSDRVER
jgi:Asp-tRNA(Asn)/Glu-tRNA(Gln) amidotransferase A subunit family amidase